MNKLKFAKGNAKLSKTTAIFSLPAGHTCCGAKDCLAKVNKTTGKLEDGPDTKFRCYATAAEYMFPNVRKGRWNNLEMLRKVRTIQGMADLICASLPKSIKLCRIHQAGDFFSQDYFDAWLEVARRNPHVVFYGYTKALLFLIKRLKELPNNFKMVASKGGKWDSLIDTYHLRYVEVVYSEADAKSKNLPIDHDDSLVWSSDSNFALLVHGTQPKGSIAGKALATLRAAGIGGYKSEYFAHYEKKQDDKI